MASWKTIIEAVVYITLLFVMVPVKLKNNYEIEQQFQDYLLRFNKTYNEETYQQKLEAFKSSLDKITFLNKNKTEGSAQYGLTKFSDMLPEEFEETNLNPKLGIRLLQRSLDNSFSKSSEEIRTKRSITKLPEKVDWREKKVITEIKNQYGCGACWAFSAIETMESMYAIQKGKLLDLSVQQMIDCAINNDGCDGGDICSLLSWMSQNKIKAVTESLYPLTLKNSKCSMNNTVSGVEIDDFVCDSFVGHEDVLLQFLAEIGPIAVAINAKSWQNYVGGVIQYHCESDPSQLNHAVQIVGYDLNATIPHYIIRNTWGQDFGDEGYLYIAIGKNLCGLADEVSILKIL